MEVYHQLPLPLPCNYLRFYGHLKNTLTLITSFWHEKVVVSVCAKNRFSMG